MMFADAISFNQNLSGWCVSNILSEPDGFSLNSPLSPENKPQWGSCPFVSVEGSGNPGAFELFPNSPNPFNPETMIRFQLPASVLVTLTVYDVLGRPVAVLINEPRPAGIHDISFDATGLASGTYFYRLIAGDQLKTGKMVLSK